MDFKMNTTGPDASLDILSDAWCNSAIQVFQPTVDECSNLFKDKQIVASENHKMALTSVSRSLVLIPVILWNIQIKTLKDLILQLGERNLKVDEGEFKTTSQIKIDDLKVS